MIGIVTFFANVFIGFALGVAIAGYMHRRIAKEQISVLEELSKKNWEIARHLADVILRAPYDPKVQELARRVREIP